MVSEQKVIVVYGSTGTQGFPIASSLLKSKNEFIVRALTRRPTSEKAQELATLGAEVVKADGFSEADMTSALTGAWGFWLNTDHHDPAFSTPDSPTDEELVRRLINIAAKKGVKVFIYSACESPSEISNGEVVIAGMDAKNRVVKYAQQFPEFDAVIGATLGWYFENFTTPEFAKAFGGFPLFPDNEGIYTLNCPQLKAGGGGKIQHVAMADDFGEMVHGLFLDPLKYRNQIVQCLSDTFSFEEMIEVFKEVSGKQARYIPMASYEDFPTYGDSALEEFQLIFRWIQWTGGLFLGLPDDHRTAQHLKDEARRDKGLDPKSTMTLKEYFSHHFGK